MSTTIDFRTMPANVPSLCIPRVFPNIDERRIRGIFDSLNMGEIARVDIVHRQTDKGEKFNRIFIHWKRWNDGENANQARERLLNGKEIKIIYDDPWFWKISAYREPVKRPVATPAPRSAPRLQFDLPDEKPVQRPRSGPRRPGPRPVVPRQDQRRKPEETPRPSTPEDSPPPRESVLDVDDGLKSEDLPEINYGNPPVAKKINFKTKPKVVVEE